MGYPNALSDTFLAYIKSNKAVKNEWFKGGHGVAFVPAAGDSDRNDDNSTVIAKAQVAERLEVPLCLTISIAKLVSLHRIAL